MKKFAIYLSKTGYYCREYIDRPSALHGILAILVTDDMLPVVLDGSGGFSRFSRKDPGYCTVIESELDCPLRLEEMFFKNHDDFRLGWVSPDGDTYACDFTGHAKAAAMIAERFYQGQTPHETVLGRRGWLKIIDSWDGTEETHGQYVYALSGRITHAQADILFDLGLYDHEEVRELLGNSENVW